MHDIPSWYAAHSTQLRNRLDRIGTGALLPFALLILFVVLQALFNVWTGLTPNYFKREFLGATVGSGILILSPALFFRGHLRYGYLLAISLFTSVVLLAQFLYFSYAQGFLQASALQYALQAADQRATIMTLLSPALLVFLSPILLTLSVYRREVSRNSHRQRISRKEAALVFTAICVLGLVSFGVLFSRDTFDIKKLTRPEQALRDMNNFIFAPDELVKQIGILNYSIRDGIGYTLRSTTLTQEDIDFVTAWFIGHDAREDGRRGWGVAKDRNIIMIQVESLEQSMIGATWEGKEITPRLNALARDGFSFPTYYTQVGPGNTADAEFVTLNSLYPLSNTVAFIDYAHNTYSALPRLLAAQGYTTAVFHDDVPTFWNRSNIYPSLGYQKVYDKSDYTNPIQPIQGHLGDRKFFQETLTMLETLPHPFMATVITMSSHTPFEIPDNELVIDIPDTAPFTERQRRYIESIAYTDHAIGEFIQRLKDCGSFDDTLIVVFGDHGSFSGIHERFGAEEDPSVGDLFGNRVPLIIVIPKTKLHGIIQVPGSHLDLAPTLMNLLGLHTPKTFLGQDLLNTKNPVVTHRDPDSQAMNTILTSTRAYIRGTDAVFEHGTCLALPQRTAIPIGDCAELYTEETRATQASDLLVKGNLLPMLFPEQP